MGKNVAASNGLIMAEAVSFALAEHMSRTEAKKIVSAAVKVVLAQNRHLVDVVAEKTQAPVDWAILKEETQYFGVADAFIDRVLAEVAKDLGGRKQGASGK